MIKNRFLIVTAIITGLAILLSGCGQRSQSPQPQPRQQPLQSTQQSDKIPDQLTSMEDSIERVFKTLDGPSVMVKEEDPQKQQGSKSSGSQSQDKGSSQDGQNKKDEKSSGGSEGGQVKGGQQTQAAQPPQPQDPWSKVTPIVNNLHYQWNSYMPSALKAGANKAQIDNFSNALNSLTNTIAGKNKTNSLMATSYLYAYIPDLYSLYKTKNSPEIKKIRYYTRNVMLNAMTANWTQADYDINSLKASWALYKTLVPKEQQEVSTKLDFSIYELEKVVKEKNQSLIDIKGRVALSNVEAIEKAAQEASSSESR